MDIENTPIKIENLDRIPLKERMEFQLTLIELMLGKKSSYKNIDEWNRVTIEWVEKYRGIISDIIDNTENKEVRDLIMKTKYKDASDIVAEMLKEDI